MLTLFFKNAENQCQNIGRKYGLTSLCFLLLFFKLNSAHANTDFIDYTSLNHTISVDYLRSGNNDAKGMNEFYFQPTVFALINSKEERKKKIKDRTKISFVGDVFGEVSIKNLTFLDKPEELTSSKIDGDTIRQLISDMMREHSKNEKDVSLIVEIKMYEKNKKYIFMGEDVLVGSARYYILSDDVKRQPLTQLQHLIIQDKFGTYTKLKVDYASKKIPAP